jgi:RHS repeat-associated protein
VANQYSSVGGVNATYNNGDLTAYNGWLYTYDAMNRLTTVSGPGGVFGNFYYDGLGRQVAFNSNRTPSTIISLWDGWNLAAAYLSGGSTPSVRFNYAGNDLVRTTGNPQTLYYYADAHGSTTHVASNTGTLLEKYTYDVYGTPTFYTASGTVLPNGSAYGVELLYTGCDWLGDFGLYDMRNRFYKPEWGRFLQPDPIGFAGDASNLYRYCANNPVNSSDPSGLGNKLDGSGENIPECPPIHVTSTYINLGLSDPAVSLGAHGSCVGCGGGGRGTDISKNASKDSPAQAAANRGERRKQNESFQDCLTRHAKEAYGDKLVTISDNLGYYGLASLITGLAGDLVMDLTQVSMDAYIDNAASTGARQGGSMLERAAANERAVAIAGKLAAGRVALGVVSKASVVVGGTATAISIAVRADFVSECLHGGGQ